MPFIKYKAFGLDSALCYKCGKEITKGQFNWSYNTRKAGMFSHKDCLLDEKQFEALVLNDPIEPEPEPEPTPEPKPQPKLEGKYHYQMPLLMQMLQARTEEGTRLNFWIAGPAGSGKTSAARLAAGILGLDFDFTGAIMDASVLLGYVSQVTGKYIGTSFRRIWEHGGVFLLDDFDASDPVVCVSLNAALAGTLCAFPDKIVPKHPDCAILLSANTWGSGATAEYVGRNQMDKAFINRFVPLDWQYDNDLERETCGNPKWALRVQALRARVQSLGIKFLITPRQSYNGAALLKVGISWQKVEEITLTGLTETQKKAVLDV